MCFGNADPHNCINEITCLTDRKVVPKKREFLQYILSFHTPSTRAEGVAFADTYMSVESMKKITTVIKIHITMKKLNCYTKTENLPIYAISSTETIKTLVKETSFANVNCISLIKISCWCLSTVMRDIWEKFM